MNALNNLLGTLTGPRRLRSALRQKTVALSSLLVALDSPAELRGRIPAAVFGGDVFGVMSSQLRAALIVPPPPPVSPARGERRRLNGSSANPAFKDFQNSFPLLSEMPDSSVQWADSNHDAAPITTLAKPERLTDQRLVRQFLPLEKEISRNGIDASLPGEASEMPRQSPVQPAISPTTKSLPLTPALVSCLNRYWQAVREGRDTGDLHSQPLTEPPANTVSFPVADSEQRTAPRAWPTSVGRDVSQKLRSVTDLNAPLKSRLSSAPDRQIQNVFNIEVNHANHQSSNFDDLGDRLAQILHEQALQHGIDVT
jgi:hypothetical protein